MDANKISDEVASILIPVKSHSSLGKPITKMNWHKIDSLYNLEIDVDVTFLLREVCNQVIHSYVFIVSENVEGYFSGIFVTSDRQRNKELFFSLLLL